MSSHQFTGSDGRPFRADLHLSAPDAPLVLVAHGFKGFRDWGFFPFLAESLREAGLNALRFDFSHNGVEERDFDRLDLFALDTWTRHQEDLAAILSAIPAAKDDPAAGPAAGGAPVLAIQPPRIGILGHSRGGSDAVLFAAQEPRIDAVCTWAGVANLTRGFDDAEVVLRRTGYYPIQNARTRQLMPVARAQFDDARRYDPLEAAGRLRERALLVVHGDEDISVPVADAHALARAHGQTEAMVVLGAGHTFGATHPFRGPTRELESALSVTIDFFRTALGLDAGK